MSHTLQDSINASISIVTNYSNALTIPDDSKFTLNQSSFLSAIKNITYISKKKNDIFTSCVSINNLKYYIFPFYSCPFLHYKPYKQCSKYSLLGSWCIFNEEKMPQTSFTLLSGSTCSKEKPP